MVNEDNAIEVLEKVFPELPVKKYEIITSGWDNVVILVNGETAFKIPRTSENALQLKREVPILAALRDSPLLTPRLSYVKEFDESLIIGYGYIPGRSLNSVRRLSPGMVDQLSNFLNYLYDKRNDDFFLNALGQGSRDSWVDKYGKYRENLFSSLYDVLDDNTLSLIAGEFDAFFNTYTANMGVSPIHGDLYRDNVLVDAESGKINGIIDWGTAEVGDPAIDFAALAVDFSVEEVKKILSSYRGSIDDHFGDRLSFYWKLEPVYGIVYYMNRDEKAMKTKIEELVNRLRV